MKTVQLPAGYCPITGFTMYNSGRLAENEKQKKRNAYRKKKQRASIVVAMYDKGVNATIIS